MNLILSKLNLKILCNNSPVHNIQKSPVHKVVLSEKQNQKKLMGAVEKKIAKGQKKKRVQER